MAAGRHKRNVTQSSNKESLDFGEASAETNRINLITGSVVPEGRQVKQAKANKRMKTSVDEIKPDPTVSVMMLKHIGGKSNKKKKGK